MTVLLLKLLLAYLLGSLSGSLVIGKLRGFDIRAEGSGNAGGTNALRTRGLAFALPVVIVDVGKGLLAATLLASWPAPPHAGLPLPWVQALCGVGAILGHLYPLYFGFRGGKGAATFVGVAAALAPWTLLPVLLVWLGVLVGTGYVGLATMTAALAFVPFAGGFAPPEARAAVLAFGVLGASLVLLAHRSNIRRLLAGTENRFERVRIQRWLR